MPERIEFLAVLLAAIVALVIVAFAVAAGASAPAPEQTTQDPACSEWTDGCIVCARTPQGLACSTPGIACVRQAPRCLKP